jgi:YgiT-type zinc finger domain-containing protein
MYCEGELESQLVTRLQHYQGHWVIIENVPTLVCQQCGERFYPPQAHDLVVSFITGHQPPVRTEIVQVYDTKSVA